MTQEPRVDQDKRIADAAREFYKSRVWYELYKSGVLPVEWPEYIALRDAIQGK